MALVDSQDADACDASLLHHTAHKRQYRCLAIRLTSFLVKVRYAPVSQRVSQVGQYPNSRHDD